VVRKFSSAKALLDAGLSGIGCLVTDIGMPAMDGFEFHDIVKKKRPDLSVFFMTGRELAESVGLEAACFGSTKELLDSALYERSGCLVLDRLHRNLHGATAAEKGSLFRRTWAGATQQT
jgi:FixJ family two-component response regulator